MQYTTRAIEHNVGLLNRRNGIQYQIFLDGYYYACADTAAQALRWIEMLNQFEIDYISQCEKNIFDSPELCL